MDEDKPPYNYQRELEEGIKTLRFFVFIIFAVLPFTTALLIVTMLDFFARLKGYK